MKYLLSVAVLTALLALTTTTFAYNNGDGTHTVRSYTKNDGTTVREHKAGNPGSGVHCYNNVCS